MTVIKKEFKFGERNVVLETGLIAKQATASVFVNMDGTVVLVTVVGKKEAVEGGDFFPLTVNFNEKTYAAGKIPGGFFKREGRPTEKATLTSRLIDRPIRPLFPKGFKNEVQVVATVLSVHPDVDADIPAMIGASAALAISGMPFGGPIGAARVGYDHEKYLLNPSAEELDSSYLDMVVAGTEHAVLMVESEADVLSEEAMLGAVTFAHEQMQPVIQAINEFKAEVATPSWDWQSPETDGTLEEKVKKYCEQGIREAYRIKDKMMRYDRLAEIKKDLVTKLGEDIAEETLAKATGPIFEELEQRIVRGMILDNEPRIDGRDNVTVRPIDIKLGLLPKTHGSALFTRGETQALVTVTLGSDRDAQLIDALEGEYREDFMLHYNFPPYCVGETGFMGSPKRREIGHGRLAKRSVLAILPNCTAFPYVMRIVSEIMESNGSSSMASVCGATLAMMDAGVPIKAPVAGVAMGLVKEGDRYTVLTDILGDEDHYGDMDFKVAGTETGVTALQMDIKIDGITKEIMENALGQARDARLHILSVMKAEISEPRSDISANAPRITSMKVPADKIRDIIGKGGATIRSLTEETGAIIDISDDGEVKISAASLEECEHAKSKIETIITDPEIGKVYDGKVEKITDFGAFVSVLSGNQGLVHISQISEERVEDVRDVLTEGQEVKVRLVDIDRMGRLKFSMKQV